MDERVPVGSSPRVAAPGFSRRVAQATIRLKRAGAARPVVVIPARDRGRNGVDETRRPARRVKLPPIWLLANVILLLVAGLAVFPRLLPVDAASACAWHTVVPGDTLGNLGWKNHTSALALARANDLKNPNLIYVGQRLCIPMSPQAHAHGAPAVPAVAQPPKLGTARGVSQFIAFVLPYARRAHAQTGWPTSLILAQWGVEHGWHLPSYTGYNFGNCGAIPGEPTIGGLNVPGSPSAFSYARTPEDGLRQYVHVAHLGYYMAVAPAAARSGVDAAARALGRSPWDAGHYTDHGDPGSSLLTVLRVYNLYWYDRH
jgi:LysM repeat protein